MVKLTEKEMREVNGGKTYVCGCGVRKHTWITYQFHRMRCWNKHFYEAM